jgi:hypothetical protein
VYSITANLTDYAQWEMAVYMADNNATDPCEFYRDGSDICSGVDVDIHDNPEVAEEPIERTVAESLHWENFSSVVMHTWLYSTEQLSECYLRVNGSSDLTSTIHVDGSVITGSMKFKARQFYEIEVTMVSNLDKPLNNQGMVVWQCSSGHSEPIPSSYLVQSLVPLVNLTSLVLI